ncbi:GDYXXLXY domain-containing protein [Pannonibacter carbonis]|uniref:GDYXXLXY domain-containing protein n=1 Tax=Pannonibacter carbonis TaxID=2067569 RepID=UPI0018E563A4|nr:GDYXXLXY domain-containing protein [Pannonibacter carbonis]
MTMPSQSGTAEPVGAIRPLLAAPYLRWGLIILLQLLLIGLPLAERASVHLLGQEVRLEVRPVDPRDLLRGDYVIINLAITQLDPALPGLEREIRTGETVYVELAADEGGLFQPVAVHRDAGMAKGPVIAGTAEYTRRPGTALNLDYGIDAFFVPEGEGLAIENTAPERISLVVSLDRAGRSAPLRLLVDGREILNDAGF